MDYIASMFRDGMTWKNRGKLWHLDHKVRLADFDLIDREQFLHAAHFTNYQPLLIEEHLTKTIAENSRARKLVA